MYSSTSNIFSACRYLSNVFLKEIQSIEYTLEKLNEREYNLYWDKPPPEVEVTNLQFVDVSGHNLESSQT